jgi:hypothetical protein
VTTGLIGTITTDIVTVMLPGVAAMPNLRMITDAKYSHKVGRCGEKVAVKSAHYYDIW